MSSGIIRSRVVDSKGLVGSPVYARESSLEGGLVLHLPAGRLSTARTAPNFCLIDALSPLLPL